MRHLLIILLVSLLAFSLFVKYQLSTEKTANGVYPDVFVGIDVAYHDGLAGIKGLINEVSSYTNLIVIGSTRLTYSSNLDEACQYAYDKGLYFIAYSESSIPKQWLDNAASKWGNHFLGVYAFDEEGGKQIDLNRNSLVKQADSYSHAETRFVDTLNMSLNYIVQNAGSTNVPLFSSDYALYWFDYKAGYDTLFAEFGWNHSRQLHIALCRGAARVQNKDWGVMVTWTYNGTPYIESGDELYNDMVLAYNNGAKYIIVFDTNANYTQDILTQEHLQATQQFWQYVRDNPRTNDPAAGRVAFVLPNAYGYGFRGPNDKIWGLWEADNFAEQLCLNLNIVMQQYGSKLDIVYDDPSFLNYVNIYGKTIFWNGTVCGELNQC
jgi:hypothetical protein